MVVYDLAGAVRLQRRRDAVQQSRRSHMCGLWSGDLLRLPHVVLRGIVLSVVR
jgi:hypothetical protein